MSAIRVTSVIQLVCVLTAAALGPTGCTSMHRVVLTNVPPQPRAWNVGPGENVRVTLIDGRRADFRVKAANADAIIATDDVRYELTDIATVERRKFSWLKTTSLAAGIFAAIVLVAAAVGQAMLAGNI